MCEAKRLMPTACDEVKTHFGYARQDKQYDSECDVTDFYELAD